jgi:HK97 family phage major capsid protein
MSDKPFFGSRAARKAFEAKSIFDVADDAGRELSADERARVTDLLDGAKADRELEAKMTELGHRLGAPDLVPDSPFALAGLSPGERFVRSPGYRKVKSADGRGQQWSTGLIEVQVLRVALEAKGTLLESAGGGGGALVPVPQVVPGVVDTLFRPLVLEDLLLNGQATGNSVRCITEGTATSGAAGVAEGALKPESTLGFATADEPIKKIATSLVISDETLEDAPAIQSFVNGHLSLFVRLETERRLLRGTSGGNEVQGLLTSRNVPVFTAGTALGNIAVQLFKAATRCAARRWLSPTGSS